MLKGLYKNSALKNKLSYEFYKYGIVYVLNKIYDLEVYAIKDGLYRNYNNRLYQFIKEYEDEINEMLINLQKSEKIVLLFNKIADFPLYLKKIKEDKQTTYEILFKDDRGYQGSKIVFSSPQNLPDYTPFFINREGFEQAVDNFIKKGRLENILIINENNTLKYIEMLEEGKRIAKALEFKKVSLADDVKKQTLYFTSKIPLFSSTINRLVRECKEKLNHNIVVKVKK